MDAHPPPKLAVLQQDKHSHKFATTYNISLIA